MTKLKFLWIRVKYQYYKLYWKVRPPLNRSVVNSMIGTKLVMMC